MKQNYSRWVKMPTRYSRKWYNLMYVVTQSLKYGLINLELQHPNLLEELKHSRRTTIFYKMRELQDQIKNPFVEPKGPIYYLIKHYGRYSYGMGVLLKFLQPYILPWIKISKEKLAKEYKEYIHLCGKIHWKRNEINWSQPPPFMTNTYLKIIALPKCLIKRDGKNVRQVLDAISTLLYKKGHRINKIPAVGICKDKKGRGFIGVPTTSYIGALYDHAQWSKYGKLKVDKSSNSSYLTTEKGFRKEKETEGEEFYWPTIYEEE